MFRHPSRPSAVGIHAARPAPSTMRVLRCGAVAIAVGAMTAGLSLTPWTPAPEASAEPTETATPEIQTLEVPATKAADRDRVTTKSQRTDGKTVETTGTLLAEIPAQDTKDFSTLGVTWTGDSDTQPQIEVRTRAEDGWSEWSQLETEDSGPDGGEAEGDSAKSSTAPTFVGDSDGVEVRVLGTAGVTAKDIEVSLVDPQELSTDANPQVDTSQAPSGDTSASTTASLPYLQPKPSIVTRSGWGADEKLRCNESKMDQTVLAAIVHHTAGVNNYSKSQVPSIIRGIYAYHTKTLGWCDIGYNFLIDKWGRTYEGRYGGMWKPVHGAHAGNWNTNTVGVSFMGNYETASPSSAMLEAGAKLIAWKLEGNYRDPKGKVTIAGKYINRISGHGDVMQTACPGRNVRSKMGSLRNKVDAKIGSFNTPIYKRWHSVGTSKVGSPYVGEHLMENGRATRFTKYNMYYSPGTGTHWLGSTLKNVYVKHKEAKGHLGFPTSDQKSMGLGSVGNTFETGGIYHTPSTGGHAIYRSFYSLYNRMGSTKKHLGLPKEDQGGWSLFKGSQVQKFQHGTMYWTGSTGSAAVYKSFYDHYAGLGKTRTRLGLPLGNQAAGKVSGSQVQKFQKGGLYWTGKLGTQEVNGAMYKKYASLGAETSKLGMPTKGDHAIKGGRMVLFEGGRMTWNASTGKVTVTYN